MSQGMMVSSKSELAPLDQNYQNAKDPVSEKLLTIKVKKLVIIADDDPEIIKLYRFLILSKLSECEIIQTCKSGAEVVNYIAKLNSEGNLRDCQGIVILMDYQMPEMDGLTASRVIRSMIETPVLKIILVSGYDVSEIGKTGCFDSVIKKPFSSNDLLRAISTA